MLRLFFTLYPLRLSLSLSVSFYEQAGITMCKRINGDLLYIPVYNPPTQCSTEIDLLKTTYFPGKHQQPGSDGERGQREDAQVSVLTRHPVQHAGR